MLDREVHDAQQVIVVRATNALILQDDRLELNYSVGSHG
jgi:hypothetical protein